MHCVAAVAHLLLHMCGTTGGMEGGREGGRERGREFIILTPTFHEADAITYRLVSSCMP